MNPKEMAVLQALAALVEDVEYEALPIGGNPELGKLGDLRRAMRDLGWPVTEEEPKS